MSIYSVPGNVICPGKPKINSTGSSFQDVLCVLFWWEMRSWPDPWVPKSHKLVWIVKCCRGAWGCSQEGAATASSDEWDIDEWATGLWERSWTVCQWGGTRQQRYATPWPSEGPQVLGGQEGPAGKDTGHVGRAGTRHTPGPGLCSSPPESCFTKWEKLADTFPQSHLHTEWVLPQFLLSAKLTVTYAPSLWGSLDELHRKH